MQTGTTEKPRLGYAKGGKIQCMADGGLVQQIKAGVNRLVGNNPGAMSARGRSEEQDAPAPTSSTTAPINKAKGGTIPAPPKGAAPHPDATGTDTVPIMGTPGEFMVKKAAVDKLGVDFMEKINSIADGDPQPKLGKVKRRRRRGKAKPMGMAGGGLVPYVDHRPYQGAPAMPPQPQLTNGMPPPGSAVATVPRQGFTYGPGVAPAQPPSNITDVTPRMPKPKGPPALPAPSTPPAAAVPSAKPAIPQVDVQRQSWQGRTGSPQAQAWQASRAAPAAASASHGAPAAAPAPSTPAPAATPAAQSATASGPKGKAYATGNALGKIARKAVPAVVAVNAATRLNDFKINDPSVDSSAAGTLSAIGQGDFAGAKRSLSKGALETLMDAGSIVANAADAVVPGDAPVSTAYGNFLRSKFGSQLVDNSAAPVAALPTAIAAPPAPAPMPAVAPASTPALGRVTAGAPVIDPRSLTNPSAAPGIVAPAQVVRTGNSYSGAPGITGDIQITDQAGTPRRMGGGVSVVPGAPGGAAPSSGSDAALFEARKAAIARGDVSSVAASYGGNFGQKVDPIDALINNGKPMTPRKAAAIAQLQAARAQAENAATDRTVATTKAGAERESIELTNREKRAIVSAQDAYAAAKTPAERAEAEQRLRAVQGKYEKEIPNRFTVVPGGQEIGADGVPFTRPASVINNQTGEWVPQPQSRATTATPRAQYDAMKKGDVYIGTDGKQYIKG